MHLLSEVLSLDWLVVWYTIGPNILIILKQSQNKKGRKFDSAASKMVSFFKDIFVEGKKIIKYFVNDLCMNTNLIQLQKVKWKKNN